MLRYIFSLLLAICCATHVAAQADPATEAAKDELWAAISASDYAAVEAIVANAHADYLKTGKNQDQTRELLGLFDANNPMLDHFADAWLETYPNSPFAHTARAMLYNNVAWNIRGEGLARFTYPDALREFSWMQFKAWEHAEQAYEADNRLLPASDATLRLALPNGERRYGYDVLHQVMKTDPNMGSLRRGLWLSSTSWGRGGGWDQAEKLCDSYGPDVDWHEGDPVTYCKLVAGAWVHHAKRGQWAHDILKEGDYPSLELIVVKRLANRSATRADAHFIQAYLQREGVTDADNAGKFDRYVAHKYNLDFMGEAHSRRARAHAREAIKRDPYNPELLETLLAGISGARMKGDRFSTRQLERPTPEERLEYTRRLLVASPYDPQRWYSYGTVLYPPTNPEDLLKDEPFRINTVVYSDHKRSRLLQRAIDKWNLLDSLERLESETQSDAFQGLDDERKAEVRGQIQRWLAARATIDMDQDIRCPMMRAYRLFEALCKDFESDECDVHPQQAEMFEIVRADVNKRQVCTGIMSARTHELFFDPVPVDLSAPEG